MYCLHQLHQVIQKYSHYLKFKSELDTGTIPVNACFQHVLQIDNFKHTCSMLIKKASLRTKQKYNKNIIKTRSLKKKLQENISILKNTFHTQGITNKLFFINIF